MYIHKKEINLIKNYKKDHLLFIPKTMLINLQSYLIHQWFYKDYNKLRIILINTQMMMILAIKYFKLINTNLEK